MILYALALLLPVLAQGGDLDGLLERIAAAKDKDLGVREPLIRELCARDDDASRRAALRLLDGEPQARVRTLLLEHLLPMPGLEQRMLAELERGEDVEPMAVAARWFVEHRGAEGAQLLVALHDEKIEVRIRTACLMALGRRPDPGKAFAERWRRLGNSSRLTVLASLRGLLAPVLTEVRKEAAASPHAGLQGEALVQLVREGDGDALATVRRLARGKSEPELVAPLFEALAAQATTRDLELMARMLAREPGRLAPVLRGLAPELLAREDVRAWVTGKGAGHARAEVRTLALSLATRLPADRVNAALAGFIDDERREIRRRALVLLAGLGDARAAEGLERELDKGADEDRAEALEALASLRGDDADFGKLLVRLGAEASPALRMTALELAADRGLRGVLPLLPALLQDRDWRLRATGIRVAMKVRDASSIPLLIQAMKREDGRLEADCRDALASLTRFYKNTAEEWERWWKEHAEGFELPPPAEEPVRSSADATQAEFYGIPIFSKRITFVLDTSGSMGERVGTGTTRIRVAREALKAALRRIPPDARVNVVFFDTVVRAYAKRLVEVGRELDQLVAFVDKAEPLGATNLWEALLAGFDDQAVDTLFVLSDGEPSAGEITDPELLGDEILRRNRLRRLRIHTVSVGLDSALLRRLAEASGGRAVRY
ncbi:MAG: VWA domain-containing protein [Planctomycetota bacterium]